MSYVRTKIQLHASANLRRKVMECTVKWFKLMTLKNVIKIIGKHN